MIKKIIIGASKNIRISALPQLCQLSLQLKLPRKSLRKNRRIGNIEPELKLLSSRLQGPGYEMVSQDIGLVKLK